MTPKKKARKGWESAFKEMHENGDDQLLICDVFENENAAIELKEISKHPCQSRPHDQRKQKTKP
mgnify:FL=1